ncbi:MAG: hypothetical protein WBO00_04775 [Steroidobacteraceae bacterium]
MDEFAVATGLIGTASPRRYLWTDAFAVCNFLGLHLDGGDGRDLDLALRLVDQVHRVLGRHRQDDPRQGWISGLADEEGERHPTRGGLRIGKERPERQAGQPFDPRLEWDRDGQYFHYLTQWMHSLHRVCQEIGQPIFHDWAVELAQTAHARFTRSDSPAGQPRMVWKMSVGLDRVLVPSMGQHDPLDALLAYLELRANAILEREIREARVLCAQVQWETDDPLGIGTLLTGLFRLAKIITSNLAPEAALFARMVAAARISLEAYTRDDPLSAPAESRLAFRELGLAIGLHAIDRLAQPHVSDEGEQDGLEVISSHRSLASRVDAFWSAPENRQSRSWKAHADINGVMLATSLIPRGYLGS